MCCDAMWCKDVRCVQVKMMYASDVCRAQGSDVYDVVNELRGEGG